MSRAKKLIENIQPQNEGAAGITLKNVKWYQGKFGGKTPEKIAQEFIEKEKGWIAIQLQVALEKLNQEIASVVSRKGISGLEEEGEFYKEKEMYGTFEISFNPKKDELEIWFAF